MAVTTKVFGLFLRSLVNKEIDLDSDVIKVMLCTSAYTPDQDTHRYKSSVTGEITGTGYTAGGATLAGVAISYDTVGNDIVFDANDVVWANSTLTARYAVIYDATPATDATRPLLGWVDFGADVQSSSGPFTITWDAAGILIVAAV